MKKFTSNLLSIVFFCLMTMSLQAQTSLEESIRNGKNQIENITKEIGNMKTEMFSQNLAADVKSEMDVSFEVLGRVHAALIAGEAPLDAYKKGTDYLYGWVKQTETEKINRIKSKLESLMTEN